MQICAKGYWKLINKINFSIILCSPPSPIYLSLDQLHLTLLCRQTAAARHLHQSEESSPERKRGEGGRMSRIEGGNGWVRLDALGYRSGLHVLVCWHMSWRPPHISGGLTHAHAHTQTQASKGFMGIHIQQTSPLAHLGIFNPGCRIRGLA